MTERDIESLHRAAVECFIKLGLTYRFSATLMPDFIEGKQVIRFLFSKPSQLRPVPEITVGMDLIVLDVQGTTYTYALFFESQKYKRVISVDSENVTGNEFNERLLDKVFAQKDRVRHQHRWVPQGDVVEVTPV